MKNYFKRIIEKINFSVMLIPISPSAKWTTKTFRSRFVLILFLSVFILYTIGLTAIWLYTPAINLIPKAYLTLSDAEKTNVHIISQKIETLLKEIEILKNSNERLKKIIISVDSTAFKKSGDKNSSNKKIGGNILNIVKDFYTKFFQDTDKYYFLSPIKGFVTKDFNPEAGHFGIDYVVKEGTPVFATANGYVIFSGFTVEDGYTMILAHPDDFISVYKHCSSLLKKEREFVVQGEIIALSGNTGKWSTGPHLHFEIWKNGKVIDPKTVLINK